MMMRMENKCLTTHRNDRLKCLFIHDVISVNIRVIIENYESDFFK